MQHSAGYRTASIPGLPRSTSRRSRRRSARRWSASPSARATQRRGPGDQGRRRGHQEQAGFVLRRRHLNAAVMVAVKASDVDTYLARLDRAAPVVLIFGPDAGLVSERVNAVIAASVDDP